MQNANSAWLNGRPFDRDLEVALATPVLLANDANCFALSEASMVPERTRTSYSGLFWGQDAAVASSSMGGCWADRAVLAANGSQPIALGHVRRISRTPMLVRTQRVLRNMGLRPRHGCGSRQANGGDKYCRRDCCARREWKWSRQGYAVEARRSVGARAGARHQHHRSRCYRARRGSIRALSLYERLPRLMGPYIFADRGSVVIKAPKWGEAGRARGAAQLWDLSLS
jgi:fructokinase